MSLLRAAEGRDGLVRNRSSSPSATRREDGADEEADDGVADKREYFHGVNEDKNRGKAGRYRSTIYFSQRWKVEREVLRSQLSNVSGIVKRDLALLQKIVPARSHAQK